MEGAWERAKDRRGKKERARIIAGFGIRARFIEKLEIANFQNLLVGPRMSCFTWLIFIRLLLNTFSVKHLAACPAPRGTAHHGLDPDFLFFNLMN